MNYKLNFAQVQEIWFTEETISPITDIVFYHQMNNYADNAEKFTTLLLDLTSEENVIWCGFTKTIKNEINRASLKDELVINIYDRNINYEIVCDFIKAYNEFTQERNKSMIKIQDFENYRLNNSLVITNVSHQSEILVWHTYIKKNHRIRLKTSNSIFLSSDNETKNLIGRANKLLHWEDIKYFKNAGYKLYDFGGWYDGSTDKKLLGINKFKESFGGYKEISYNYTKAVTFKGKTYLFLSKLKSILLRK